MIDERPVQTPPNVSHFHLAWLFSLTIINLTAILATVPSLSSLDSTSLA